MVILEEPIKEPLELRNYIGGEWVESEGKSVSVVNPATNKTIAKVPISTRQEINAAENILFQANEILQENRILKQANLTIKQLDRIFDLGTELTLDVPLNEILKKITTAIRRTLGWNVVILDMKMPHNGGLTFEQLRKMDSDVKIFITSGYTEDHRIAELINQGCDGFIQKPFSLNVLSQTIEGAMKE